MSHQKYYITQIAFLWILLTISSCHKKGPISLLDQDA